MGAARMLTFTGANQTCPWRREVSRDGLDAGQHRAGRTRGMATRKKPDLAATIADAGWKIEAQWLPMQNLTSALPSAAIFDLPGLQRRPFRQWRGRTSAPGITSQGDD